MMNFAKLKAVMEFVFGATSSQKSPVIIDVSSVFVDSPSVGGSGKS